MDEVHIEPVSKDTVVQDDRIGAKVRRQPRGPCVSVWHNKVLELQRIAELDPYSERIFTLILNRCRQGNIDGQVPDFCIKFGKICVMSIPSTQQLNSCKWPPRLGFV